MSKNDEKIAKDLVKEVSKITQNFEVLLVNLRNININLAQISDNLECLKHQNDDDFEGENGL